MYDPEVCARCFKFFYWDTEPCAAAWDDDMEEVKELPALEDIHESSESDSVDTGSSRSMQENDSQSEMEAFYPEEKNV